MPGHQNGFIVLIRRWYGGRCGDFLAPPLERRQLVTLLEN